MPVTRGDAADALFRELVRPVRVGATARPAPALAQLWRRPAPERPGGAR